MQQLRWREGEHPYFSLPIPPSPKAHLEPSRTSTMEFFPRLGFKHASALIVIQSLLSFFWVFTWFAILVITTGRLEGIQWRWWSWFRASFLNFQRSYTSHIDHQNNVKIFLHTCLTFLQCSHVTKSTANFWTEQFPVQVWNIKDNS